MNEPAGGNKPPAKVAWSEQHGQPQEELGSRNASVDVYAPRRARPDIYGQGGGAPANIPTIRERELGQPAPGLPRASALGPPGRQQARCDETRERNTRIPRVSMPFLNACRVCLQFVTAVFHRRAP